MRKFLQGGLVLLCALPWSMPAAAAKGAVGNGYVTGFAGSNGGFVYFFTNGTLTAAHDSCALGSGLPARWGLDVTTPTGQALLSILITAKATHTLVRIDGSGSCVGGSESPELIVTDNSQ